MCIRDRPSIQQQGIDRIIVQLPGLDDPSRIKKLLGKTAKLNFQLVSVLLLMTHWKDVI